MNLSGHVAAISGGLGDIGRAIALELARHGADIALCGLQAETEGGEFLATLSDMGRRASYARVDVTDAAAVQSWIAQVEALLGSPTLIIPNAAQVTKAECLRIAPADWSREIRVNLDGAFYFAQAGAARLVASGKPGRIVFIGSWAGHRVHSHIPAYSVAKAGLRMLAQCLALELAPHGILVNEVAPGIVDAGLSGVIMREQPGLRESLRNLIPIHELISPAEVARAVAYLCDPGNRHMTGSVLVMDGGLSLQVPKP